MNDQEINRAVAESVGWRHVKCDEESRCAGELIWVNETAQSWNLPDYCNSYDAIMPLVKALKKGREERFVGRLEELALPMSPTSDGGVWRADKGECHALITATPRQLCEAYLAVGGADA